MTFPRLLLMDFTRVDGLSATGQLKAALFRDWPENSCLQIFGTNEEEFWIAHNLSDSEQDFAVAESEDIYRLVEAFAPEVIYYRPVGDRDDLHALAMGIIKEMGLPLVTHLMDDWPERMRQSDPERAAVYERDLKWLFDHSFINLSISEAMTETFRDRYGHDFTPVSNGVEDAVAARLASLRKKDRESSSFKIRYMGGLAADMTLQSVLDVADAVALLREEGRAVDFEIYTMAHWFRHFRVPFRSKVGTFLYRSVDKDLYFDLIAESDVCLIVYNFDEPSLAYTRYSMANKLPEIMASKALLLAYGPKEQATVSMVAAKDVGLCVTEQGPEALADKLRQVMDQPQDFRRLSARARRRVRQDFRMEDIRARFCQYLRDAAQSCERSEASGPSEEYPTLVKRLSGLAVAEDLAFPMRSAHAVVLPSFRQKEKLDDFLARAAWFFPQTGIERLTVFVSKRLLADYQWQLPQGFDPSIERERFARLSKVLDLVEVTGPEPEAFEQQQALVGAASLIYYYDIHARELWNSAPRRALTEEKLQFSVDPKKEKNEAALYLEAAPKLIRWPASLIEENHKAFLATGLFDKSYDRSIILATGPSISDYRRFDIEGAMVIACNSIIKSREIMDRARPQILVFADPIFHYGPSVYAAKFRYDLERALERYDFTIVTPLKYYATLLDTVPSARGRAVAVPFERNCGVVMDLQSEFRTQTTDNILTLLMLPLAYTFSDKVLVFGCDGRPEEDNTYFWKHQNAVQYADKMDNIKTIHSSFFVMDYDDYYTRHQEKTERFVQMAESLGKSFQSGGFSYIPAMRKRGTEAYILKQGVSAGGQRSQKAMIVDLGGGDDRDRLHLARMKEALYGLSKAPVDVLSLQTEEEWWHQPDSLTTDRGLEEEGSAPLTLVAGAADRDASQDQLPIPSEELHQLSSKEPEALRRLAEDLFSEGETFFRSPLWQNTRISVTAEVAESSVSGWGTALRSESPPDVHLNLSLPLNEFQAWRVGQSDDAETSDAPINGKALGRILIQDRDDRTALIQQLGDWQGLVYSLTAEVEALAELLKGAEDLDLGKIDLIVDVGDSLLDLTLRQQLQAGAAVRWLIDYGERTVSTVRVRAASQAVQQVLKGASGIMLERAPPVNVALPDHLWKSRPDRSVPCGYLKKSDRNRLCIIGDGSVAKSRQLAEETAKTFALEDGEASLYLRGLDPSKTKALTDSPLSRAGVNIIGEEGEIDQALAAADLIVILCQDLLAEQGFLDIVQRAVYVGTPLVLWSRGRLGQACLPLDLGVPFDRLDRNSILGSIRASLTNLSYYVQVADQVSSTFAEEASWSNAAVGLFAAGQRPEVTDEQWGLVPLNVSMQGSVSVYGSNSFRIPAAASQSNLLLIFQAGVSAGDKVEIELRFRASGPSKFPLRIFRHGTDQPEGSEFRTPKWEDLGEGVYAVTQAYTFRRSHEGFRLEISGSKENTLELEILDLRASLGD